MNTNPRIRWKGTHFHGCDGASAEQRIQIGKTAAILDTEIIALRGPATRVELQESALLQRISGDEILTADTEAPQ